MSEPIRTQSNVSSKSVSLIRDLYTLKKITVPTKTTLINDITENYTELMYSEIMKSINSILTSNNIVKMPILYHNNIYYIENETQSPIYHTILRQLNTCDDTLYIQYTDTDTPQFSAKINIIKTDISLNTQTIETFNFNESELVNNGLITSFFNTYIFNKARRIISVLNQHLKPHNIIIKKASLGFRNRIGLKLNDIENLFPEILMDSIFLSPTLNVFQYFEFAQSNNNSNITPPITDLLTIYKAFTNQSDLKIETYETIEHIVTDVKSTLQLD